LLLDKHQQAKNRTQVIQCARIRNQCDSIIIIIISPVGLKFLSIFLYIKKTCD
jgi:hypothetical protein